MKTSAFFAVAVMALSRFAEASAASDPTRVIRSAPDRVRQQQGKQSPSTFPKLGGPASQGCFKSSGNLTSSKVDLTYLSSGSCETACKGKNLPVMALTPGQCLCGDTYPPKDDVVNDSNCDFPCPGYPMEACGSLGDPGFFSVFNVGIEVNVPYMENENEDKKSSTSSTTSASSTAQSTSAPTAPAATQTQDNSGGDNNNSDDEKKSGPNTAGIAAGVVVGVAVVAGGIGGFFFWMRRRRNAEIEEDHRRNAAVNAFISGSKPPSSHGSISMTDSRLDPVLAHRRMSDGSIADNEDYSRRILRVS